MNHNSETSYWQILLTCSSVSIVNFEHVIADWDIYFIMGISFNSSVFKELFCVQELFL